jgi:threonine dehydratase
VSASSAGFGQIDPARALPLVRQAAARLAPHARRTPCVFSYTFSESAGCDVWLKLENLQRTGSFKVRGALNKLLGMDPAQRARGLVAASAGNHAQGVALAARIVGARATIFMPVTTALLKVQRTEGYGAEVRLVGDNYDQSQRAAAEFAGESGAALIHPFDDPEVILGQATVGLEVAEDLSDVDTVVVPIGGGGLIAGLGLALKALQPRVRLVGVQAEGAAPMVRSFECGSAQVVEHPSTLAEGIRVGRVGVLTFPLVARLVDQCVTVGEDELIEAVAQTLEKSKVVAETAGVAGIAALIAGKIHGARKVAAVISGGNIDLNLLARVIEAAFARAGRTHLVRVRLSDQPGGLARVLEVIAQCSANVLEVQHYRSGWNVPVGSVDVEIQVELRRPGSGAEIDRALTELGLSSPPRSR